MEMDTNKTLEQKNGLNNDKTPSLRTGAEEHGQIKEAVENVNAGLNLLNENRLKHINMIRYYDLQLLKTLKLLEKRLIY